MLRTVINIKLKKRFSFMNINRFFYLFYCFIYVLLCSCSASNCPLENTVTCNYGFYDSNGTPIIYNDEITISTLLPGYKTVYIYKKLNEETVSLNYHDETYINNGFWLYVIIRNNIIILYSFPS